MEGLWLDALWTFYIYWRWWIKGAFVFLLILTPVSYITHNFQELLDGSPQKHPGQELVWAMDIILSLIQLYFFIG